LATRQNETRLTNDGVIAVRKAQNGLVHSDQSRRSDHSLGVNGIEARNVFRNGPFKKLNFLRDVAYMGPNLIMVPFTQFDAV
jgi:hypothetical protein